MVELKSMDKIILDLCGGTGSWSKPYKEAGYNVKLITLPQDVRLIKYDKDISHNIRGILCAPPCTVFANSGSRWKRSQESILEAIGIVDACLRIILITNPVFWALENPIGKLKYYLGKPKLYFNPCDYGDPYTKKTCLWGNFNIPVKNPIFPFEGSKLHKLPPSKNRSVLRSITPPGFAKAFFEANK